MFELTTSPVQIAVSSSTVLAGDLLVPPQPLGWVIFAHGSGSSRLSPRNRQVARRLHRGRIATLLADLLTPREDEDEARRFDIDLLSERLRTMTQWLRTQEMAAGLPVGYFGASTGAAAALRAAAERDANIAAVVCRGGRPDLVGNDVLARLRSPVLLIVGSHDTPVLDFNRQAYQQLSCTKSLHLVQGATHLFEEAGTLEEAAQVALSWFNQHFGAPG